MPSQKSAVEAFLTEFHDTRPGLTSKAFGELPVLLRGREYRSSYEILAAVVPAGKAGLEVLDLACGDGYLLALLASRASSGVTLCGADMSFAELAAARDRLGSRATLQQAKAQALPYPTGRFDYVLCHLALMLMDDAVQVVREIRRVLKPGATLAAIVGAPPPPSAAFAVYVEALSRRLRQKHLSGVRFGDRRFRSVEGIAEILSGEFRDIVIEDIHTTQRLTPDELWRWFLDMYDLYFLGEADRQSVERDFFAAVVSHCGPDGKIDYCTALRHIRGTAA
jgi:ubiquinone/menaquinone biosynthesis C-methylase UbiE